MKFWLDFFLWVFNLTQIIIHLTGWVTHLWKARFSRQNLVLCLDFLLSKFHECLSIVVANAEGDGAVVRSATDKVDVPGSKGP